MGTRADFYIGRGKKAQWIGSTAWDGYPKGITLTLPENNKSGYGQAYAEFPEGKHLFDATTEAEFRDRLDQYFSNREDVSRPSDGWPWPWDNSHLTDYSYAFDEGKVWGSGYGHEWFDATKPQPEDAPVGKVEFPDMKEKKNVTLGKRSGVIVVQS